MSVGGFLVGREESRRLKVQQCGGTRSLPSHHAWPELGTTATQSKSPVPEGQRPGQGAAIPEKQGSWRESSRPRQPPFL